MGEDLLTIGRILKPHGVRGDVRVLPLTDWPERFLELERVFVGSHEANEQYAVRGVSLHGKVVLLGLTGIDSRDRAEDLRGHSVMIPESERVELPPDHYYIYELIGVDCYTTDGTLVGKVTDVLSTGANDVYVVEGPSGVHYVPAVKAVVREIDLEAYRMVVEWLDGM